MRAVINVISKVNRWLDRRSGQYVLLTLLATIYVICYVTHPLFPGNKPDHPEGWWSWWDQSEYLKEAFAISHLRLSPETYRFPPGYPILGAPFVRWMPTHPFFFPDLILTLGSASAWWLIARRITSNFTALCIAVVFVAAHAALLAKTAIIPFNTIPTEFTLTLGILILVSNFSPQAVTWLSILAGCTYLIRPADGACFAPMLVCSVLRLPSWRIRFRSGLLGIGILVIPIALLPLMNHVVFGFWESPYEQQSWREIGFFSYPISFKAFWILVDGNPLFGETKPGLLFRFPWLFFTLPGAIYWIKKERWAGFAAMASVTLIWLVYLNYNDFLPSDIYRFTLIHYLAGTFPILFLISATALLDACRTRGSFIPIGLSIVLCLFACGIQMVEKPLGEVEIKSKLRLPFQRPLIVTAPGISFAEAKNLRLDGRLLKEYRDFLTPLEDSKLRLLLSAKAEGVDLLLPAAGDNTSHVNFSQFGWRWLPTKTRFESFFQ